jgi:hypothetical protein
VTADLVPDGMGRQVLAERHQQGRPGQFLQPGGETEVIGVEMGDDDARDAPATRRRRQPRQDLLPAVLDRIQREAGVDDHPAVVVLEQPEVDVVEREGQRHPQPVDTGRNLESLAGSGRGGKRIIGQHRVADCKNL